MTTEQLAVAPDKSVKRIGWALLGLALVSPILLAFLDVIDGRKAGELTVQVGFAWLVVAIVVDLMTRKRGALVKANGRIVSAALALAMSLVSSFNFYRDTQRVDVAKKELIEQFMTSSVEARSAPAQQSTDSAQAIGKQSGAVPTPLPEAKPLVVNEADRVVGFLSAMKVRAKKYAEDAGALERQFGAIDLGSVLTPQRLTSSAGIQESRKTLEKFKALVAERDNLLKQHFVLSEKVIHNAGLNEREVNEAMGGFNSTKSETIQAYADIGAAQLASVKAIDDILNFAELGMGRMSVQNGKMMFQTQPELDEYQRLMAVLTNVSAKEDAASQRVNALSLKNKQQMVEQLK